MKYSIFTLLLLGSSSVLFAQESQAEAAVPSKTRFGITANIHQSNISGIHDYSKGRIAPAIGVVANIPLQGSHERSEARENWFFQPAVELSFDGEKADDPAGEVKYYQTNISIPLYVKYYFSFTKGNTVNPFFIMAGPHISFTAGDKVDGKITYAADAAAELKKFNFGLSAAAGYAFTRDLEIFARYDHGLSKAYSNYSLYNTYHYKLAVGLNYFFN